MTMHDEAHRDPLREKSFFRKTRTDLLRRFLEWYGPPRDSGRAGHADGIYAEYSTLPDNIRARLHGDLELLTDVSYARNMPVLVDLAQQHGIDCQEMTAHDLALTLLLDHKDVFDRIHHRISLSDVCCYPEFRGLGAMEVGDPERGKSRLQAELSRHHRSLAKGLHVHVESYRDTQKLVYRVCHEEYLTAVPVFHRKRLVMRRHRPVSCAEMVYYPRAGRLKVIAQTSEHTEFCRDAFARHVLGRPEFFQHSDMRRIYNLDRLKRPWRFEIDPADGIESVQITELSLPPNAGNTAVTRIPYATDVPARLREACPDLTVARIQGASLAVKFRDDIRHRRDVTLVMPNHGNLGDSRHDQLIRRYLVVWELAFI